MAIRTKSRTRIIPSPAFIPEYYVGDHLQVGRVQGQGEGRNSSKQIQETISYGVGGVFNRESGSRVVSDFDHSTPTATGQMRSDTWYVRGASIPSTPGMEGNFPTCEIMRYGGNTKVYRPGMTVSIQACDETELARARMNAYNKLIHVRPQVHMNALRSVCELKDSKQTLNGALQFLNWAKTAIGRKHTVKPGVQARLSAGSKLSVVASAYLWYKFGVEPTIADIRQFCTELGQGRFRVFGELHKTKSLARRGETLVSRYVVRAKDRDILSVMFDGTPPTALGDGKLNLFPPYRNTYVTWPARGLLPNADRINYGRPVKVTDEISGCYFAKVKQDINISGLDDVKRHWAWNFPGLRTQWDLLPFSFLIDWIVGVGDTIEALEKRYLYPTYESYLGTVWRFEKTSTVTYRPIVGGSLHVEPSGPARNDPVGGHTYGQCLITGTADYSMYKGERVESFSRAPVGAPSVVWPKVTKRIKLYQISSGMALLAQAAEGWKKVRISRPNLFRVL